MELQFQLGKADIKRQGTTLGQIQKLKSARLVEQKKNFMIYIYLLLGRGTKLIAIANTEDFGYGGDEQVMELINTYITYLASCKQQFITVRRQNSYPSEF